MGRRSFTVFAAIVPLVVVVLALAGPAAATSWVLALPPMKSSPESTVNDPRAMVRDRLDQQAPVAEWRRGEVFDSGEACENARLSALRAFDDAAESVGAAQPSGDQVQRLTLLGQRAFGRCVPWLALSDR